MEKVNVSNFIGFVIDLVNEDPIFLEREVDAKFYFLHGGCYELYKVVKHYFPQSLCMINENLDHCAIGYDDHIYDANGVCEDKSTFHIATKEDIDYMKRSFGLSPEAESLTANKILESLEECNIKGVNF